MDTSPKLFIGSSAESLPIAKALGNQLATGFEVKLWDSAFDAGEFFLERLRKELLLTDFALFILSPDDKVNKRGKEYHTVRDNVIFELGLFIGAIGLKKAHFVLVDTVKGGKKTSPFILTDLDGIKKTRLLVQLDDAGQIIQNEENTNAFQATVTALTTMFNKAQSAISLSLLPSTSLAVGYYRNFLMQACKELISMRDFELNGLHYDLSKDIFDFYVIIPDAGNDASHEAYQKFVRHHDLVQIEIKSTTSARTFPFFISSDVKNGRIQLYDLPTTLRSSREIIHLVMPPGNDPEEIEHLELKEIQNFKHTIRYLLNQPESAGFRDNIHLLPASELFQSH